MIKSVVLAFVTVMPLTLFVQVNADELNVDSILQETGFQGGLIVHLGCGDGKLAASLGTVDNGLVHGLDADAKNVRVAREHVHAKGLYGKVSIAHWDNVKLPYNDKGATIVRAWIGTEDRLKSVAGKGEYAP